MTATLIATGWIRRAHHILDVGCGTGAEAALLAKWGCKRVEGIDTDPAAIRVARGRATRQALGKRLTFHVLDAADLPQVFPRPTFDVVLHTLVANNLRAADVEAHFAGIHAVMKRDGLLVVLERVVKRFENAAPDGFAPYEGIERWFELTPGVATHLPEAWSPGYARVVLWLGRPRA